jgi:threonyl-tRNA synthetase
MITNLEDGTITSAIMILSRLMSRRTYPEYRYYQTVIMSVAGAYWRGDEKQTTNTCLWNFISKTKDLTEYLLFLLEEAKRRDHRSGKELELFAFSTQKVGRGLPLWLPKTLH